VSEKGIWWAPCSDLLVNHAGHPGLQTPLEIHLSKLQWPGLRCSEHSQANSENSISDNDAGCGSFIIVELFCPFYRGTNRDSELGAYWSGEGGDGLCHPIARLSATDLSEGTGVLADSQGPWTMQCAVLSARFSCDPCLWGP
jgi:hypothetical protein